MKYYYNIGTREIENRRSRGNKISTGGENDINH